jgi:hippurate hydrolase
LGVAGETPSAALHNPYYDFNDAVIEPGVAVWTALVEQSLPLQ